MSSRRDEIQQMLLRIQFLEKELASIRLQLQQWQNREEVAPIPAPSSPAQSNEEVELNAFEPLPSPTLNDFAPKPLVAQQEAGASSNISPTTGLGNTVRSVKENISVVDYFRFRCELFANDPLEMERVLEELEKLHSLADLQKYLTDVLQWDMDRKEVCDFYELLRPYYNS